MSAGYVMVVDDDEALRDSVCELLEQDGFRTVRAESGAAALRRLRSDREKPDLILLDLMMPDMNGWQFREEQLRDESLAAVPVVVMTAQRNPAGIHVNEVLYKPVKLKKLLEVIRRHATPAAHGEAPAAAATIARETSSAERSLFAGGGELGARMAEIDWSRTALGPVSAWPQSLRTCVRIILTSRQPMFVWWGESLINLYNDAYKSIIGGKHPGALAQPASVVWKEIWDEVAPRAETAMRANEGTYDEALLLIMERHGYAEETYYTFSYSPVPNDLGGTGGIICANTDDTDRIIGGRQLALLRELAGTTVDARTVEDVCLKSMSALATNERDIPFALLYVMAKDRRSLQLEAAVRLERGHPAAPERILLGDASVWPCGDALRSFEVGLLTDLASRFGSLPGGAWDKPPTTAAVVPIAASGETGRAGVLIVGLNPFRLFDESYTSFLELAAGQISASIANAHAYEEERKRAEALAEIDRAKTAFFSNVSHEFRTPLTLLLGPAHDLLLGIHGQLPEGQREQLEVLHRNGLRLQKLVNALLDFSRLEAGRVRARYEETDLPSLTRDLASTFQSAIERAGLTLIVDCPPLDGSIFVDRDMWEKIVLNLLSNALKFTFQGRIEVALRTEGEHVALSVSDTGVGIPAEELPRVFERFHRIEGTRARTHEGSGIGLALVQELARLHGGSVRVHSVPGAGTTFTVRLPRGSAHLPEERVAARSSEPPATLGAAPFVEEALRWLPAAANETPETATPLDRASERERRAGVAPSARYGRILLADDNADMRDYVRRHLERYWDVEAVADGAQALAAARARPPDLVLTDIMMPELDGIALLGELRRYEETRDIPVILLSARSGEEANVEGLSAGAEDYLTKPFSARELVARVRTRLELSRLCNEMRAQGRHLFSLFDQAPAPIAVLRGPELVFEMANALYLKVCGRTNIVGKPLLDAIPEFRGQGFDELLLGVMQSGRPFAGEEMRLLLDRRGNGVLEETYWTFTYAPLQNVGDDEQRVIALCHDVTEMVLARHRVEESEERFRRIVTQVQAGIAQVDLAGRFMLINDRYREIVGRSDAELRQLHMQDITHPDDLPRNVEAFQRLLEQGAPFVIEKRYVKPDGSIVWVQNSVARIDDREGRAQSIVSVTVDITQRKFAEEALKESEERFRNMADHAPVMIWVTAPDGRCTYLSQSWYDFTGMTPESALGRGWLDVVHPDDRQAADRTFALANENRVPFRIEYRLRRSDGVYRWAIDSATPRLGAGDEFLGYIGSVMDLTERRESELALAASETKFRQIFENVEVAVWEEDLSALKALVDDLRRTHGAGLRAYLAANPAVVEHGMGLVRLLDVNPATLRLFGAANKEHFLASLQALFLPDTPAVFLDEMVALAEGRRVFSSEVTLRTLAGEHLDLAFTIGVPPDDQNWERALVTLMDISARKMVEREREARVVEMERAVRFSEVFAGILGHDLRNPLGAILAGANLIDMLTADEKIKKPASRIVTSAARMERMIAQLLDFTRIRLGRGLPLERAPVDLSEVCRSIIDELESVQNRQIDLQQRGDLHGTWDRDRLSQLVSNLAANACQHGTAGERVAIELDGTDADRVRVCVHNHGVIRDRLMPVIFDPLRHSSDPGERREGSSGLGLGLYITQQIALSHGGTIHVDSSEALGTCFTVELPRHAARDTSPRLALAEQLFPAARDSN